MIIRIFYEYSHVYTGTSTRVSCLYIHKTLGLHYINSVLHTDRSETSYSQPAVDLPPSKDKQPPTIKTKQLGHNNQQDASVQTTSYPTTFDIPNHPHPATFDIPNHPPTPILPYVLPAGKLEGKVLWLP